MGSCYGLTHKNSSGQLNHHWLGEATLAKCFARHQGLRNEQNPVLDLKEITLEQGTQTSKQGISTQHARCYLQTRPGCRGNRGKGTLHGGVHQARRDVRWVFKGEAWSHQTSGLEGWERRLKT